MLCGICKQEMDTSNPLKENCGGDCLECMAWSGDPDAIKTVAKIKGKDKMAYKTWIVQSVRKDILEQNINEIGEAAFRAGYMRALQDVLAKAKTKIATEIASIIVEKTDETQAASFIKEHPFIFKS